VINWLKGLISLSQRVEQLSVRLGELNASIEKLIDQQGLASRVPEKTVLPQQERESEAQSGVLERGLRRARARMRAETDAVTWIRRVGHWKSAVMQVSGWLDYQGLPTASLLVLFCILVLAAGVAFGGWLAAPTWFPESDVGKLPVDRRDIAKATAIGSAIVLVAVTSPLWFQRAKQLRPILLPGAVLGLIVVAGGAMVLLSHASEFSPARGASTAEKAYFIAIGAGVASVLTASVKWAFDMASVHRESLQNRNASMANRVDTMINQNYLPMLRKMRDARESLRRLHQLNQFPELSAIAAERHLVNQGVAYRLALFLLEERTLYQQWGGVFLASRRIEKRVSRLLIVIHLMLGLEPEHEDELAAATQKMTATLLQREAASKGPLQDARTTISLQEFRQQCEDDDSLESIVRLLGHRLEGPRILTGLVMAIGELRAQLTEGINEIYRDWYMDWEPVRPPAEHSARERRIQGEWSGLLRQIARLRSALGRKTSFPTDIAEQLTVLTEEVRNSLKENDPVSIFAWYEDRLDEIVGHIILRFRSQEELDPITRKILATIGSEEESRTRFSLRWITKENEDGSPGSRQASS
jgi:hypothetical protein